MNVYWLEQTAADVPADDDWLSAAERARLAVLHIPKRRADWRLGRWTAKRLLAAYAGEPGLQPTEIEIHPTASGAPEAFFHSEATPFTISLTHRDGVAVCALARGDALGCDLELIEPRSPAFMADYFSVEERRFIAGCADSDRARMANLIWSAKESALKAMRTGLRHATADLSVALAETHVTDEWLPLQVRCSAGSTFHGWWRQHGRFVLTLVAAPSPSVPIRLAVDCAVSAGRR